MTQIKWDIVKDIDISSITKASERPGDKKTLPIFTLGKTPADTDYVWGMVFVEDNYTTIGEINTTNQAFDFYRTDSSEATNTELGVKRNDGTDDYIFLINNDSKVYKYKLDKSTLTADGFYTATYIGNKSISRDGEVLPAITNTKAFSIKVGGYNNNYWYFYTYDLSIDSDDYLSFDNKTENTHMYTTGGSAGKPLYLMVNLNTSTIGFIDGSARNSSGSKAYAISYDFNGNYININTSGKNNLYSEGSGWTQNSHWYGFNVIHTKELYGKDKRFILDGGGFSSVDNHDNLYELYSTIGTIEGNNNCIYTVSIDRDNSNARHNYLCDFDAGHDNYYETTLNGTDGLDFIGIVVPVDGFIYNYYADGKYRVIKMTSDTSQSTQTLNASGYGETADIDIPNGKNKLKCRLTYNLNGADESNEDKVELYYKFDNESSYTKVNRDDSGDIAIPSGATKVKFKFVIKKDNTISPTVYNVMYMWSN